MSDAEQFLTPPTSPDKASGRAASGTRSPSRGAHTSRMPVGREGPRPTRPVAARTQSPSPRVRSRSASASEPEFGSADQSEAESEAASEEDEEAEREGGNDEEDEETAQEEVAPHADAVATASRTASSKNKTRASASDVPSARAKTSGAKSSSSAPEAVPEILARLRGATFDAVADSLLVELLRVVHCPREHSPELRSFALSLVHYLRAVHPKCAPLFLIVSTCEHFTSVLSCPPPDCRVFTRDGVDFCSTPNLI